MSNPTAFKCRQLCNTYIKLWSARTKGIDGEIKSMLRDLRDPIARAILKYILFLRSASKDVIIERSTQIRDPKNLRVNYSPNRLTILHAIPAGNTYWLYIYILGAGDFTVLKAKKSDSLEKFLQATNGRVIELYTISGKVRHFVGINKSKRYGSRNNPVKYKYRYNGENNASIPCITEDDFERYKAFYECLLGYLGIVPPLIVELPPNGTGGEPSVGIILPVKYNENAIQTYILPIDAILALNAGSFSAFDKFMTSLDDLVKKRNLFPPWYVKAENIVCEGLLRYLYRRKSINVYLTLIMNELRAFSSDLYEATSDSNLRKNYVELIYELRNELHKYDHDLYSYIESRWQQDKGKPWKEVIQEVLLNDTNTAMKLLNYLPKPSAIKLYGLGYIKRVIKALLCLRSQSH